MAGYINKKTSYERLFYDGSFCAGLCLVVLLEIIMREAIHPIRGYTTGCLGCLDLCKLHVYNILP